jgi:hypothetical protein
LWRLLLNSHQPKIDETQTLDKIFSALKHMGIGHQLEFIDTVAWLMMADVSSESEMKKRTYAASSS